MNVRVFLLGLSVGVIASLAIMELAMMPQLRGLAMLSQTSSELPSPVSQATPTSLASTPEAVPKAGQRVLANPLFQRRDLIYGTEIGAWRNGHNYDAHPLVTNPACQVLAREARIPVVRWMPGGRFADAGGDLPNSEFNNVIDGILRVGAMPLIKMPPGIDYQCGDQADLAWLKEIVRRAGERVTLYEFTNEPNYYCKWTAEHYTSEWIRVVPELKRYARSLGFEIDVGGPAWSMPYLDDLSTFLGGVQRAYERTRDDDLLPSFVSFHSYASQNREQPSAEILAEVVKYGDFVDTLRTEARRILGNDLPIAITEWNYTTDIRDTRDRDVGFITAYTRAMLGEFRQHGVWLAIQFTFASNSGGGVLDMVDLSCNAKPMYTAFAESRAAAER